MTIYQKCHWMFLTITFLIKKIKIDVIKISLRTHCHVNRLGKPDYFKWKRKTRYSHEKLYDLREWWVIYRHWSKLWNDLVWTGISPRFWFSEDGRITQESRSMHRIRNGAWRCGEGSERFVDKDWDVSRSIKVNWKLKSYPDMKLNKK